jgi:pantoate--beta-alanine ligase
MIEIIKSIDDWKLIRKQNFFLSKSVGLVPTMGALHQGHISLIKRCMEANDVTVVSIFVNPTQFNDQEDFRNYPDRFENDVKLLEKNRVGFLFVPEYSEIYSDDYNYRISEKNLSGQLCGAFRPGHFDGVLTVVMKLFNIVSPQRAYFGEKDYQQLLLIKGMCKAFFLDIDIVACPTVREADGLAMSSRNLLLTSDERKRAAHFPELLTSSKSPAEVKKELEEIGFKVDYIEETGGRRFGAVHLGKVRLIDNVQI